MTKMKLQNRSNLKYHSKHQVESMDGRGRGVRGVPRRAHGTLRRRPTGASSSQQSRRWRQRGMVDPIFPSN